MKITNISEKEWAEEGESIYYLIVVILKTEPSSSSCLASAQEDTSADPRGVCVCQRMDVCQKPQATVTEGLTYPSKQTTKVTSF